MTTAMTTPLTPLVQSFFTERLISQDPENDPLRDTTLRRRSPFTLTNVFHGHLPAETLGVTGNPASATP